MADTIDRSTPFLLGGVSFGGFVAQEAAQHLQPQGLILISSCRSRNELPRFLRTIGLSAHITPPFAISLAKRMVSSTRKLFGVTNLEQAKLFDDMLYDTDSAFMRWCIRAVLAWEGIANRDIPTLHVHGAHDRIIPLRGVKPDIIIPGAGHVVSMSHPEMVNRIIEDWIQRTLNCDSGY